MTLTSEELEAIRQRAEAATQGNWRATLDDPYERTYVLGAFNGIVTVVADIKGDADAEFIANARQDVPKLLAEVDRLRKALQEIADIDDWDYGLEKAKDITFKTIAEPEGWA
jgi:hypothetical protein